MTIILFQPFDVAKWGLIGFNAFLAFLAEGGITFNNPLARQNRQETYNSLPEVLRVAKQLVTWVTDLPSDPWFKLYVCFAGAYVVVWLVLTWVGCRGEFIFLDNIVRNRAALAAPWHRYAKQGNVWFVFRLGLALLTGSSAIATVAAFVFLNWSWINGERDPAGGEIATVVFTTLAFLALGILIWVVVFLIRSLALPLYFKQTMSLGTALLAVMTLVFTRPVSIFLYMLLNFVIAIVAFFIICFATMATICATCCVLLSVSCFPFLGSLMLNMVIVQVILPLLVFQRCFQLSCLEQFGPQYNVFSVDLPPAPLAGA
jgi:hypothetical protein